MEEQGKLEFGRCEYVRNWEYWEYGEIPGDIRVMIGKEWGREDSVRVLTFRKVTPRLVRACQHICFQSPRALPVEIFENISSQNPDHSWHDFVQYHALIVDSERWNRSSLVYRNSPDKLVNTEDVTAAVFRKMVSEWSFLLGLKQVKLRYNPLI